jgi:hypothetical protein
LGGKGCVKTLSTSVFSLSTLEKTLSTLDFSVSTFVSGEDFRHFSFGGNVRDAGAVGAFSGGSGRALPGMEKRAVPVWPVQRVKGNRERWYPVDYL